MDHSECFPCIVKVFGKRCAVPIAVAVVIKQHSLCVGEQADIAFLPVILRTFNQFSVHGRNHICHRGAVLSQIMHKLGLCQIILF